VGHPITNMEFVQSNCFECSDNQRRLCLLLLRSIKQFTAKQQKRLQVSVSQSVTTVRLSCNTSVVCVATRIFVCKLPHVVVATPQLCSCSLHFSFLFRFIFVSHACLLFPFTAIYCATICSYFLLPTPNSLHRCCTIHLARSCTNTNEV